MRIAIWCVRAAVAAVGGACIRLARRLAGRKPRIWHGFFPLQMTPPMVLADRAAGFPTRSVMLHARPLKYSLVSEPEFDVVLTSAERPTADPHWRALLDLLWHGDIWSTHFESLFFTPGRKANDLAFALLRAAGIRIIVSAHGGDVLHRDGVHTRFEWLERHQRDYPDWDLTAHAAVARERIRLFTRHAALVLPADPMLRRFLPRNDVLFKYFPVDCETLRPVPLEPRAVPVIVHAPNHRFTKGTDFLLAAVERLRAAGIAAELRLVEGVARSEALAIYAQADIIADQFCCGAFGGFALEGLALGKPVLTYLDRETLADPVFNLPIVNATPENLEEVLAVLLQIETLRTRLGRAGRAAAEQYQSVPALAEVWRQLHEHVWRGVPLDLRQTAHFSPSRTSRSFSEDPRAAEFWPVDVSDLRDQIDGALDAVR